MQKHKNGQAFYVWEKLSGVRNEALDTSFYASAAAHLVGLSRIKWREEEKEVIKEIEVGKEKNPSVQSSTRKTRSLKRVRRKAGAIRVY